MRNLLAILVLFLNLVSLRAEVLPPPTMSGPAGVLSGTSYTYSYTGFVVAPMWDIFSGTATITSTWSSGGTYYASITWTTSGVVRFYDEIAGGAFVTKSVTVVAPPVVANTSRCGTGTFNLSVTAGSGATLTRWYSASSGGTLLSSTTSYTTPTLSPGTYSYWLESYNSTYSLTTPRVQLTVTVGVIPSIPTSVADGERCGEGTVTLLATPASPATSLAWYSAPEGGVLLDTALSLTTPSLTGDAYYYITSFDILTGCESARVPIHASVYKNPNTLSVMMGKPIYGSGSTTLEATFITEWRGRPYNYEPDTTDYEIGWYATEAHALARTNRLANGIVFNTPLITQSTGFFVRVRDNETGCMGAVAIGTAVVTPFKATQNIRTDVLRVLGKTTDGDLATLNDYEKVTTVTYLDGIGRPRQQAVVKGSATGRDIVQPFEYDAQGRSSKNFLPFVADDDTTIFRSNYYVKQHSFYLAADDKIADDSAAYAQTVFEPSPLGRTIEQGYAGREFQPGTGHTSKAEYLLNTSGDQVRKFNAKADSSWYYDAKKLTKVKSIDANGNHTLTFINGSGQTILVRQQLDETIEGVSTAYLETYYLYDDLGQQTYIISPKGVAELKANSWSFTQSIKDSYCNQFRYDSKGRVMEKKVPGQAWQSIIYDPLGRIVLTQDGLLKTANKWAFIKYDYKGNAVMTGIHTNTTYTTRATMQAYVDGMYVSGHAFGADVWYEKQGTAAEGYTNQSFPNANNEVLSVNYFDDYNFDNTGDVDATYISAGLIGEHTPTTNLIGLPTGSKRKILGASTWLFTYIFYDDNGRTIQVQSSNPMNPATLDWASTVYSDDGRVLYTKKYHNPGTPGVIQVLNTYDYRSDGRLDGIKQKNNSDADNLLVQYEYNSLGQLVDKKLHHTGGSNFLQSVDYRYTIRGQLKSINNSELISNSSNDETNDYFGMELLYNDTESGLTTNARYDGNISAMKWKTMDSASGPAGQRSYAYTYDKTGRLTTAAYKAKESSWDKEVGAQDEALTYDHNGNIKSLERKQRKYDDLTAAYVNETIDNLTYAYKTADKNNLEKVTDAAGSAAAEGFNNGSSNTGNDYTYDANGNLLSDANKGITSIVYNFLSKPTQVNFSDGKKIEYVYDAGGNKLTQKLYQGDTLLTTTDYVNGFVYENGTLSFFGSPEGRVVNNSGTLTYEYSIADHQGNTRVVFTSATPAADAPATNFQDNGSGFDHFPGGGTLNTLEVFDHDANPATSNSTILNGGYNSQVGVTKSFKVYPGDKLKAEVYAKYRNASSGTSNLSGFALMLTNAFGVNSSSTGEYLKAYNALNSYGGSAALGTAHSSVPEAPKAFVTILLFDKNYNLVDAAWDQLDAAYEQTSEPPVKDPFDYLTKEVTVKEEGFAYVFISNESPTFVDVYFDDVKFTHTKTSVIQYNEYYPFGLQTSTSWTRDNTKDNNYLYNAANELNKTSGWYEMFYRGYDPAIGRMLQIDPYATSFASFTTYNYAVNNPVMMNDPTGGYTYSNAAADRLYKINNPDAYTQEWAADFRSYVDSHITGEYADQWKAIIGFLSLAFSEGGSSISFTTTHEGQSYAVSLLFNGEGEMQAHVGNASLGLVYQLEGGRWSYTGSVKEEASSQEEGFWEGIWNSDIMRLVVPDVYTLDVNYSIAIGFFKGLGASETYTLNLITRGKDAGWHRTNTQQWAKGLEWGYGANLGWYMYSGDVSTLSVQTLLGPSRTVSAGFLAGANLNAGYSSLEDSAAEPVLMGLSLGAGITLGVSYGVGETRLGWEPFTPKIGN